MPGAMLPPALGQVQTPEPDYAANANSAFGMMQQNPPPQRSAVDRAQADYDAAVANYHKFDTLDREAEIERRLSALPDPGGLRARGMVPADAERKAIAAQIQQEVVAARAAASAARTRLNDAKKEQAGAAKEEAKHPHTFTDPQTGEQTTVMLNDAQYAAQARADQRAANGAGSQMVTVTHPDGTTEDVSVAQAQQLAREAQQRVQQANADSAQRREDIMKRGQDLLDKGRSVDEVSRLMGQAIAAEKQNYDQQMNYVNRLYLGPLQQIRAQENARLGKALDFASSVNRLGYDYYKTDAGNEVSQRNTDVGLAMKIVDKVLEVYGNRMSALGAPQDLQQNDISAMRRYARQRLAGAKGQTQPTAQERKAAEDPFGWGNQVPDDPYAYGLNRFQDTMDALSRQRVGPRSPDRPHTYGPQEVPGFVQQMTAGSPLLYQWPEDLIGPPADVQTVMSQHGFDPSFTSRVQAHANGYYAGPGQMPDEPIDSGMQGGANGLAAMPQSYLDGMPDYQNPDDQEGY